MCVKRGLFLIHRSLGMVLCLMLALWFASGVVMMYAGFPKLTLRERFAGLAPLELDNSIISPAQAVARSSLTNAPLRVRLTMVLGLPAYHILPTDGPWTTVFADDGSRLTGIRPEEIMASAQAFAPATAVSYEQCLDLDQWSVSSALDPFRPLHRVALGDNAGTELYVSNATGEVVRVSDYVAIAWFGVSDFCVSPAWLFAAGLRRALARRCAPDWSRLELWEAIRRKYASEAAETAAGGDAR